MTNIELWGKDHWSTFLYLETRCVDDGGRLDSRHMRKSGAAHPTRIKACPSSEENPFPEVDTIPNHNDYNCIDDMIEAGLVERQMEAPGTRYRLTKLGWTFALALRQYKADGGAFHYFVPPTQQ